ncbi:MAG: hypothetical protein U5O39_11765 [Gammaproteobacteria bacterium]|nr:hypothetical protein [Gammaproteobacteria bacterium]
MTNSFDITHDGDAPTLTYAIGSLSLQNISTLAIGVTTDDGDSTVETPTIVLETTSRSEGGTTISIGSIGEDAGSEVQELLTIDGTLTGQTGCSLKVRQTVLPTLSSTAL